MTSCPDLEQPKAIATRPREASRRAKRIRTLALVEVAAFADVRRQVGVRRAAALSLWLSSAARIVCPGATVDTSARDRIEIWLDRAIGFGEGALAERIGDILAEESGLERLRLRVAIVSERNTADDLALIEKAEARLLAEAERQASTVEAARPRGLMEELPGALDRGELFVVYQPKVHLRQQRIAGLEALIRWRHPIHGLVAPGAFIPDAEQSGDIAALTLWTIDRVVADQRIIADAGHDIPIFINIAGRLLSDAAFLDDACRLIGDFAGRIGFEITETSVIRDPEIAIANLQTFARIGITIAIDDYGAGLSSLAYLKQLPAKELKIDKLFVTQLTSSNRDPLIVRSTIDLAHALDMEVVAEGVESHATLALLSVMGCDMVQGYLISRPQPLDATLAFLSEDRSTTLLSSTAPLVKSVLRG